MEANPFKNDEGILHKHWIQTYLVAYLPLYTGCQAGAFQFSEKKKEL